MIEPSVLLRHPLFLEISHPATALLAKEAIPKLWRARQNIFRRGDPAVGLILVLEGRGRVFREGAGRRRVLHIEESGGTLGEVPLFDGSPMPASAVAAQATRGILIAPQVVRSAMLLDPNLAFKLLERLARRVRGLADRLEHLTQQSVSMRLAAVLLERAGHSPTREIDLAMPQEQFAEELGTVREVLVRELGTLVRAGVLVPHGRGRFVVRDLAALRAVAAAR